MDVRQLIHRIEQYAPLSGMASWDKSGIQIAGPDKKATRLAVALDPTEDTIRRATEWNADLILTHHPMGMKPRYLDQYDPFTRSVAMLMKNDTWLYTAHTSLDAQYTGPCGWLARALNLGRLDILEPTHTTEYAGYLCPLPHGQDTVSSLLSKWEQLEGVCVARITGENALYISVQVSAWATVRSQITTDMMRVGLNPVFALAEPELDQAAVESQSVGFGFVGDLPEDVDFDEFMEQLGTIVDRNFFTICGPAPKRVARVGYCTGSGSSLMWKAKKAGADVFITGDMKYHQALDATSCIVDVGHFSLEEEMMRQFAQLLAQDEQLGKLDIEFFPGTEPMRLYTPGGNKTD